VGGVPDSPIKFTHSFNGTLVGEFTNSFSTQTINNPSPFDIAVNADQDIFAGCSSQQKVTVQVQTVPVLTISGATNVCQGNSVNLTSNVSGGVQGGELYTWKRLSGTNETTLSDTDSQYTTDNTLLPGSYNYVVSVSQSAKGCASAPVTVSADVVSQPIISIGIAQGASSEICLGGSVKLLANSSGGINCSRQWQSSSNGTDWTSITGATNQEYSASPAVEGSTYYRATIVNCAGSCMAANSNAIEIKVRPDPKITAITASPNQICKGGQSVITVQTNGGGAGNCSINWDWKDNSGNWIGTGTQGNQLAVDNNTPFYGTQTSGVRNYRAMISCTGAGCDADNSTTALTIKEDLTVQVVLQPNSTAVCQNVELKLNGEYMGGVDNCTKLTWEKAVGDGPFVQQPVSNPQNSHTVNTSIPGSYRYRVIAECNESGCETSTSTPVNVRIKPNIPVLAGWPQQDPPLCEGVQSYTLDARPVDQYNNLTYKWSSRTNSSMNWQNSAVSTGTFNTGNIDEDTQYRVNIETECGAVEKQITIRVVPQPDTKILDGPSNVCTDQTAFYRIQSPVSLIDDQAAIQWSIVPATGGIVVDSFNHNAGVVIKWVKQGTYLLKVKHTRENCTGEDQLQVTVINPGGTKLIASPIHHYSFNNLLIHTDTTASCYQWYRYDKLNNKTEVIPDEQYQAYAASVDYNPVRYKYFAKAWIGNCDNEPSCAVVSYEVEDKDNFSPDTYNKLSVYPNPNNGYFNIQASDMPQNVVVSVTDINGRKVYEETVDCQGGLLFRTISIQEPSGIYLVTVRDFNQPGYQKSLRFVIAN
jgi:hypothetical protein